MPNPRSRASGAHDDRSRHSPLHTERELIVIAEPAAGLRATREGVASATGQDVSSITEVLSASGARLRPLFGPAPAPERTRSAMLTAAAPDQPDLSHYYRVDAPDENLDDLAEELRGHRAVRAAYVKPPAEPAVLTKAPVDTERERLAARVARPAPLAPPTGINDMEPSAADAPPVTPDFTGRQLYLGPAPAGIDAQFAWNLAGGAGVGVNIIDVEGEWRFTHEDLLQLQGGVVGGTPPNDIGWRNHGTAVMGEFSGDRNTLGITGICPDANVRGVSIFGGLGSAGAIRRAADLLSPGDIILIELHRPGPRATGVGQQGFIAMEWWPDDFDAIKYATGKGVVVVEAAGNGAEDLDAAVYDTPAAGFPANWSNPFRRGTRDSGAILVGAGAPPPGTHGRDWGPDRSRLDFSNYGSAVDVQGWGREVTSCGYGDLQGGVTEDSWYTDQFSGTSSASPIVVGAIGCVQGKLRAGGGPALTPAAARNLLRTTGSAQQDAPGRPIAQRIGNRPDLRQMLGQGVTLSIPLQRYWNPSIADHFYTTNWNELGWGKYGWGYEGVQCYVFATQVPGSVPLYRYWNPGIGDHFYTTNWSELGGGAYGWGYEGIQCYVFPQQGQGRNALYRYWNAAAGDHFYTTNWGELGWGNYGWAFEGVQCYVAAQVQPPVAQGAPGTTESVMGPGGPTMMTPTGIGTTGGLTGIAPTGIAPTGFSPTGISPAGNGGTPTSFAGTAAMGTGAPASFSSSQVTPGSGPTSFLMESAAAKGNSFTVRESGKSSGVTVTLQVSPEGRQG
jgi:hypothetical protein